MAVLRIVHMRKLVLTLASIALSVPGIASGKEVETYGPPVPDELVEANSARPADQPITEPPHRKFPLFPIGSRAAIAKGYKVQRALGLSGMTIYNVENMDSDNLAVAFAKGTVPAEDVKLIDVPFVTTNQLESHTTNTQFKADLWVFPFLNVFAAVGKVKGHINIGVDVDVDALVPPPICRPAKPCGTVHLPFTGKVDNVSLTLGGILAYGSNDWAVSAVFARTESAGSKDRSDLTTTDVSARVGPRLHFDESHTIMPYVGANYFKLDATVTGALRSGPVFADGDPIGLRYRIDLSSGDPWAIVNGIHLELGPHWAIQAEYNWGRSSDRFILSATLRP